MKRCKAAVLRSGIDPQLKRLSKLHAIRSSRERALKRAFEAYQQDGDITGYVKALSNLQAARDSIERYWGEVMKTIELREKEEQEKLAV